MPRKFLRILCAVFACSSTLALAQAYPSKPIRLLVGFGAGGVTDILARMFAADWSKRLGQPVVVENRTGANGLVAAQGVKNAEPDGYTTTYGSVTVFSPIYAKNSMVAGKELAPVANVLFGDYFIYVPSSIGINSLKDLVAWAKANPGKLRYATAASSNYMMIAIVAHRLGISGENIPYKESSQVIQALLTGDGHATVNAAPGFTEHIKSGKLRAIATLGSERSAVIPDAPTATEQGVPLNLRFTHGVWTTLGTPRDRIMLFNRAVTESLKDPAIIEKIRNSMLTPAPGSPEDVLRIFDTDMKVFTEAAALIKFEPQ
jgi:tripartite-type tricarboxylate transporter receptor subunit TctC